MCYEAKVAKGKYLCHIWPCPDKCFVRIWDRVLIPCSTCNDWWLYGATVIILMFNFLNR